MPLLQFDTTLSLSADEKNALADRVSTLYVEEMATESDHVAVAIRDRGPADLHLGRAVEGPMLFLVADVRRGRDFDRKRAFALGVMEHVADEYGVPEPNLKVAFDEHPGEDLMGVDRVGGEWEPGEEP